MDIKEYWKSRWAKNKDKYNASRRAVYAKSRGMVEVKESKPISSPEHGPAPQVVAAMNDLMDNPKPGRVVFVKPKVTCCMCPSINTKFHEGRKRWFCDVHRPGW
jgi:hypothetical protein